jgi:oligosaccharyltransferase complex subunit gamma
MHIPRLLSLLGSLAAAATASAAAAPPSARFAAALKQRYPLALGDRLFGELTAGPSRDYAAVVLLTAMDPKFGCNACRDFAPEWQLLARSWQRGDAKGGSRTVLATIDFADGRQTFQQQGLSHAPVVLLYPPTEGPNARPDGLPIRYDFSGWVFSPDPALRRQMLISLG